MNRVSLSIWYVIFGIVGLSALGCNGATNRAAADPDFEKVLREARSLNSAALGKNILVVGSGLKKPLFGESVPRTVTVDDAEAIAKQCPSVLAAAPVLYFACRAEFKDRNWAPAFGVGTTQSYLVVRDWQKLSAGEGFSADDVRQGNAVCILGKIVAHELFGDASPLGQEVQIESLPFRIAGVLDGKGKDTSELDQDDTILIPLPWATVVKSISPNDIVIAIWVKVQSIEKMPMATKEIEAILRNRHHLSQMEKNDFYVEDLLKSREDGITELHELSKAKATK